MTVRTKRLITIGQLARFAGVTVKAVRHYHKRGLLEEPLRDASGYRRYSARHALALVKIKTLADAGVPLARIKDLLAADPERFAAAIAAIDRTLQERVAALLRTRERLAQLQVSSSGDRLFVAAPVAAFLDQLRALGVRERTVQMERDVWILLQAASPQEAALWIQDKCDALGDPEFRALYLAWDEAFDWSPEDPRLAALADRSQRWITHRPARSTGAGGGARPLSDPTIAQLVATSPGTTSPAWERLAAIAQQRKAGG